MLPVRPAVAVAVTARAAAEPAGRRVAFVGGRQQMPSRAFAARRLDGLQGLHGQFSIPATPLGAVTTALGLKSKQEDPEKEQEEEFIKAKRPKRGSGEYDVVLSSGFLAFAQHSGFLEAVENSGLSIKAVMGTSAGALTGSLYAAGYTPEQVASILSRDPPYKLLKFCWPWEGGLLSMQPVIDRLGQLLPATFEELPTEFACGVCCKDGSHRVINTGPLPQAVVASAAIPILFAPVKIPGQEKGPFHDGGKFDRIGLKQWREFRRSQKGKCPPALVHLIGRSSPFSGNDTLQTDEKQVTMVKSPKSGVSLLSLGNFREAKDVSLERSAAAMETHKQNKRKTAV